MIYVFFATQLACRIPCRYKMILKVWCCADSLAILDEVSKAREKRHVEVEKLLRKMEEVTTLDTKITRALQPLWQPVVGPTFLIFLLPCIGGEWKDVKSTVFWGATVAEAKHCHIQQHFGELCQDTSCNHDWPSDQTTSAEWNKILAFQCSSLRSTNLQECWWGGPGTWNYS